MIVCRTKKSFCKLLDFFAYPVKASTKAFKALEKPLASRSLARNKSKWPGKIWTILTSTFGFALYSWWLHSDHVVCLWEEISILPFSPPAAAHLSLLFGNLEARKVWSKTRIYPLGGGVKPKIFSWGGSVDIFCDYLTFFIILFLSIVGIVWHNGQSVGFSS